MKKLLLLMGYVTLTFGSLQLQAQEKTTLYFYDEVIDEVMIGSGFKNVSPNGKYAVGTDDMFTSAGFVWDSTSKKIALLDPIKEGKVRAYDVDNDGNIYGHYVDQEDKYVPGYLKGNGDWVTLPTPENLRALSDESYAPTAVSVSADGKFVGGNLYYIKGEEGGEFRPAIWENGKLKEFLDPAHSSFFLYAISNDGTILAGLKEMTNGERLPAILVNGVLKVLYEPKDEDRLFLDGIAMHIDADNNITGYIIDEQEAGVSHGFIYNEKGGIKWTSTEGVSCSINANAIFGTTGSMGQATIIRDEKEELLTKFLNIDTPKYISNVMGYSDDGKVLAGNGIHVSEMGPFNVPYIIELSADDQKLVTAINEQNADRTTACITTEGRLFVTGTYSKVEVYNTLGACVAIDNEQGHIANVGHLSAGVYIVKVWKGQKAESFKVIKQ